MATSYLSQGVYVEEVDRGSKPIEAAGTNTAGFLGESAKGPVNEAVDLAKRYGDKNSGPFVNGLLDRVYREINQKTANLEGKNPEDQAPQPADDESSTPHPM